MRIYSYNQFDKYYLSPYVNITFQNGMLVLYQRLFDTSLAIPCAEHQAFEFVSIIQEGVKEPTIVAFLVNLLGHEDIASDYLTLMQQMGVLE